MKSVIIFLMVLLLASCDKEKQEYSFSRSTDDVTNSLPDASKSIAPTNDISDTNITSELTIIEELPITQTDLEKLSGSWWIDPGHTVESTFETSWGLVRVAFMNGIAFDFFSNPYKALLGELPGHISIERIAKTDENEYLLFIRSPSNQIVTMEIIFINDNDFKLVSKGINGGEFIWNNSIDSIWYKIDGFRWTDEDRRNKVPQYKASSSTP